MTLTRATVRLGGVQKSKTIIDLAIEAYNDYGKMDALFRSYARSQLKVLIFAGLDTTSTTICYAWLLLCRNPRVLVKLRAEHDTVLGTD